MKREKAVGMLFMAIAVGIFIPAILTIFITNYIIIPIWIISLSLSIILVFRIKDLKPTIKQIFTNSNRWSIRMKVINGLAWALPFILAVILPSYYPYLILLGIGLGNLVTYLMIKIANGFTTRGQMTVGITALLSLPLIAFIYYLGVDASIIMRLLVALAYGIGGITNLISNSPN